MNSIFVDFLPFVIPIPFVIWFYWLVFRTRDNTLDIEKGKIPIYTENCGAKIYMANSIFKRVALGKPLARFSLYDDFVVLSTVRYFSEIKILLTYSEIEKIELTQKIFLDPQGIKIYYRQHEISDYMIVWLKDWKKVKENIELKLQNK